MAEHYALFSGGDHSFVTTHMGMEKGPCEGVIYMDTSSGLPENKEWIKSICREFGWDLYITEPTISLKEFGIRYGFPKAGAHSWAMRYFKEHGLSRFATGCEGCPQYWSGVYQGESDRRMRHIDGPTTDRDGFVYRNPCYEWSESEFDDYRQDHGLPTNPHAEKLGRSPDCYCCAFGTRDEVVVDLRAAGYDDHADWLLEIEEEVQAEIGTDEDYCWLGNEGLSSQELRALMADADDQQTVLCGNCGDRP